MRTIHVMMIALLLLFVQRSWPQPAPTRDATDASQHSDVPHSIDPAEVAWFRKLIRNLSYAEVLETIERLAVSSPERMIAVTRAIEAGAAAENYEGELLLLSMLQALRNAEVTPPRALRAHLAANLSDYEDSSLRRYILLMAAPQEESDSALTRQQILHHGRFLLDRMEASGRPEDPRLRSEAMAYVNACAPFSGPTLARLLIGLAETSRDRRLVDAARAAAAAALSEPRE
jgi:hypothetical protein